jgi:beta-N-acetylhexosaminidase
MAPPRRQPRTAAAVRRRRLVALLAVAIAAAAFGALVAWRSDPASESTRPAASTAPAQHRAARLPLSRAVGRKIMTGMEGTFPSRSLRARVRRGQVGGVILFGPNVSSRLGQAIVSLQSAARVGGNPPLLIAVDQEGGAVKRLPSLPPSRAPAQMTPGTARAEGAATGQALLARGINTNLAPVADVNHGSFLGSRSFGSDPGQVAQAACAFAGAMQSAGVNATFKHFPGLGRTRLNTDLHAVTIDALAAALRRDLAPYRRCGSQVRLVMLSNATYRAFDPSRPAVLARRVAGGLLRGEFGYRGVTISDTLAAPGVGSTTTAVRASRAGVDILLYVDEHTSALAYRELLRAAQTGTLSAAAVRASAARIDELAR